MWFVWPGHKWFVTILILNFLSLDKFKNLFFFNSLRYLTYDHTQLYCKLDNSEVSVFNTTLLISEEYGRSLASASLYYVTSDEKIYNFQSYAR